MESSFSGPGKGFKIFTINFQFQIFQDKIFVYNSTDFLIDIYKPDGNKLRSIKVDYQPLKIIADQKVATEKFFHEDSVVKQYYELFKPLQFPQYFPAIWLMLVDQKNLLVITYKRKNDQQEVYLFDMEGRLIKKLFAKFDLKNIIEPYPLNYFNGAIYQLVGSEEDDLWRLRKTDLL